MIKKRYFLQLSMVILGIVISCAYLFSIATPSEEAARIRNSLVHQPGQLDDFIWNPSTYPADFKIETALPPLYFKQFIESLPIEPDMSELDKFLLAAKKIIDRERRGGPIMSNTVDALKKMQSEGIGWCSDYTQVFNGIAHTMEIPVREWGISFDGYSGYGHAFNEIFDKKLGKWVFIDAFYAFYVSNSEGEPLSVLEFRQMLSTSPDQLIIHKIIQEQFGFKDNAAALDYYQRGMPQLFLIWANDVFSYDANPLIQLAGSYSRMAEQITGILLGINQEIRLYPDPHSLQQQNKLLSLKYKVISIIMLNIILGILFLFILFKMFNRRISHG
ncbi:hypothetical protein SAMN05216302_102536 [Nitrosomonas aestuarii]|uniref:Transglutaminase-like superfamily protein n=1 Tax=Nitrosomonas aestuarii TaxID=52441 RepID=A0A1I4E3X4_9PROT|nr:transglutaminase-like domain-containing protein [Nitrosomonas aestuarii]SFK99963.1 hypothetical protein SAMN05216302_102536 [Nitrosomonas aestuarii]